MLLLAQSAARSLVLFRLVFEALEIARKTEPADHA